MAAMVRTQYEPTSFDFIISSFLYILGGEDFRVYQWYVIYFYTLYLLYTI